MHGYTVRLSGPVLRRMFFVAIVVALTGGRASAQSPGADPVEEIHQILMTSGLDTSTRESYLNRQIPLVHGVADLRRALCLQEWRDQQPLDAAGPVDLGARTRLGQMFERRECKEILRHGDATSKMVVMTMLGEQALHLRDSQGKSGLARHFVPDLLELMQQADEPARLQAARTLGLVVPDPDLASAVLGNWLSGSRVPERVAAAEGLANLMQATTSLAMRSRDLSGIECGRADLVRTGALVAPLGGRGLGDSERDVRRKCALALSQAAEGLRRVVTVLRPADDADNLDQVRAAVLEDRRELMPLIAACSGSRARRSPRPWPMRTAWSALWRAALWKT